MNETRIRRLIGPEPQSYWDDLEYSGRNEWNDRILSQLVFAQELSKVNGLKYDAVIASTLDYIEQRIVEDGAIVKQAALEAEGMLQSLAADAKSYDVIAVSHAHIDMNWMWGWDETVSVTIDTFRTMLNLMEEYPEFTFSQSQASIYRIVEQYAPSMLEEIKRRVKEGRWEITASHWVEADKNMPSGESLARHILYTKRYLSKLFDIEPDSLNMDFEPDTFGHSLQVPEILASGGVSYYYHCRGAEGDPLTRWEGPSGKSVIVYRELTWYNDFVRPVFTSYVPDICRRTGLNSYLYVYGVGDHGGGPTRRDLNRLRAMQEWPICPTIRFGGYADYFKEAERIKDQLPVVKGELNVVFTGCYTSQTRIKNANRVSEATLNEAELFSSVAAAAHGAGYPGAAYEEAWRGVMFNQFHDILPGSGVIETREHALGLFQNTMAIAGTNRKLALERIAADIDTSEIEIGHTATNTAQGAGVGFGTRDFKITQVERGSGSTRIVHLFNSSLQTREETVEILLWDWKSPIKSIVVKTAAGETMPSQVLDSGRNAYWSHDYLRLLARVKVPACGYGTLIVAEGDGYSSQIIIGDPRVDRDEDYSLENDHVRVVFDPRDASVISLIDKSSGEELIDPARPAGLFRLIQEDPSKGMAAWWVGRFMQIDSLHERVILKKTVSGDLRQTISYEMKFKTSSSLRIAVSLDAGSRSLDYHVECDWQEAGSREVGIPQLQFYFPIGYASEAYKYDVPFGTIVREARDMELPGNSFVQALRADDPHKPTLFIVTNNKYGFRGTDNAMSVSLIRGSYEPDPYPELGNHHRIKLSVCLAEASASSRDVIEHAYRINHPLNVLSGLKRSGSKPANAGYIEQLDDAVAVSAIKVPEGNSGASWIIRMYETDGKSATASFKLFKGAVRAYAVDVNENLIPGDSSVTLAGDTLNVDVSPYSLAAVRIDF
ncbi:alpha-mannosidase [Paenibacillus sp. CF384]|uniref:alpha-mannosidase n=1 Tax=Paenibacillus sp. CF384 TaxID=1884382 RepID=UPI00089D5766|nr:alpha-mannosidase [Paenibacillus sp. CF384]SDX67632.1 alpha-mannosidase [Paenibacillus sp. CF384]